jgi:cell division septal protein FtsQ
MMNNLFKKKQSDISRRRLAGRDADAPISSDIFRRNRTLTGTTSNRLASTNAKSDLESSRTRVHHLSIQRRKIFSILLIVSVSAVFLWVLVSNFTATVTVGLSDMSISKPINTSPYEKAIQEYLGDNPMSRLRPVLDQSALAVYVSSGLPEVADVVQLSTMGIGETNFVITMRQPVAGWRINDKQYYVDSKGIPFEKNYFSAPTVQIVDDSGVSLQASGTAIASKRFLSFVGRIVSLAKTSGYTVTQAILPANTTRELEVRLKENNFLVKLSIDRPAGEQVEDMVRAVQYFTSHSQTPSYIDVRVSGKAFYE